MQVLIDKAEEQFQRFIAEAQQILGPTRWEIGRIASEIKEVCGKTDAEIGEAIGLSKMQVYQRRSVWDRFGGVNINYRLSWSHFCAALSWDDAEKALAWANDCEATVAEMTAWRRVQNGEDIRQPAPVSLPELPEEHIPRPPSLAVPREATRKRSGDPETPNIVAPAAAAPHHIDDAPAAAKQKPKEAPTEDAKTRVLYAMREIMQVVTEIEDRKAIAKKFRKLADELDPPAADKTPTASQLVAAIPEDWEPERQRVAEDWARYKQARSKPERIQSLRAWQIALKQIAAPRLKDVVGKIEAAIASSWKGWQHDMKSSGKSKPDGRTRTRDWSDYDF